VDVDELMKIIMTSPVINQVPKPGGVANGHKLFETALQGRSSPTNFSNNNMNNNSKEGNGKRFLDDEDDDGDNSNSGFSSDIYRSRKIKRENPKLSA